MDLYLFIFLGIALNSLGIFSIVEFRIFKSKSIHTFGKVSAYKISSLKSVLQYTKIIIYSASNGEKYIFHDRVLTSKVTHEIGEDIRILISCNDEQNVMINKYTRKLQGLVFLFSGFFFIVTGLMGAIDSTFSILILLFTFALNIAIMPTIIDLNISKGDCIRASKYVGCISKQCDEDCKIILTNEDLHHQAEYAFPWVRFIVFISLLASLFVFLLANV